MNDTSRDIYVQKFGGTSVADLDRIRAVAHIVAKSYRKNRSLVVVVSAMSQETNKLTQSGLDVGGTIENREMDALLASGEQVTMALVTMAIAAKAIPAQSLTGWQVPIQTDGNFANALIKKIDDRKIKKLLDDNVVVVIAGFQGVDEQQNVNTLGRGGSDTSAVALAVQLGAVECQIYTDVQGVYTADPRLCHSARKIEVLSYEEMMELASEGSKILHIRSVLFAAKYKVPLRVLSSFEEGPGTLIGSEINLNKIMEAPLVTGIAYNINEAKVSLFGIEDKPGIAYLLLKKISDEGINVDIIVQNVGQNGKNDLTFTIAVDKVVTARQALANVDCERIEFNEKIAKVAVVGYGMKNHTGVASLLFKTLAKENINIELITTSEIKITVIIDEKYAELAVRVLHEAFDLENAFATR